MISKNQYNLLEKELLSAYPGIVYIIMHSVVSFDEWRDIAYPLGAENYYDLMSTFAFLLLEEYDYEPAQIEKIARKNSKIHAIIPVHPLPTNTESL